MANNRRKYILKIVTLLLGLLVFVVLIEVSIKKEELKEILHWEIWLSPYIYIGPLFLLVYNISINNKNIKMDDDEKD